MANPYLSLPLMSCLYTQLFVQMVEPFLNRRSKVLQDTSWWKLRNCPQRAFAQREGTGFFLWKLRLSMASDFEGCMLMPVLEAVFIYPTDFQVTMHMIITLVCIFGPTPQRHCHRGATESSPSLGMLDPSLTASL